MRPSRDCAQVGRKTTHVIFVLVVMLFLFLNMVSVASAADSIVLRAQYPVEGERTELYVQDNDGNPVPNAEMSATYRPGSSVEKVTVVGTTGKSGRIIWTPVSAGIVTLDATWETAAGDTTSVATNISVKFRSTPAGGILIMVLAGLLLVGGSAVRILRVLRSGE